VREWQVTAVAGMESVGVEGPFAGAGEEVVGTREEAVGAGGVAVGAGWAVARAGGYPSSAAGPAPSPQVRRRHGLDTQMLLALLPGVASSLHAFQQEAASDKCVQVLSRQF